MIHIKRRQSEDAGSSGSLNDLSFLLIVFFLVTAGFTVNKGFLLNLPEKSKPRIVNNEDLMKCYINSDGDILLDNSLVTLNDLSDKIKSKKQRFPNMTFFLDVDGQCAWQNVVDVIYFVRENNIENFSFKIAGE